MRIYLDGASEPAVDLPFIGYFDGKNAPFTRSALVHTVAMGWNNYTPIPYQKSCKIVAEQELGRLLPVRLHHLPQGHRRCRRSSASCRPRRTPRWTRPTSS